MGKKVDLTGQKFNYFIVLNEAGKDNSGRTVWNCQCDCGNIVIVEGSHLKNGITKSCGCFRKKKMTKHGQNTRKGSTSIYKVWKSIMRRCYNSNHHTYKNYGGRGIKVCKRWWKFENFYEDMKNELVDGLTIERIDNDGNYKLNNCKGATNQEQQQNKRVKGYCKHKQTGKYKARITVDHQTIEIGLFDTPEEARQAYLSKKEKYHKKLINKKETL